MIIIINCHETRLFENLRTGLVTHKIIAKNLNFPKNINSQNWHFINWNRVKIGTFLLFQQWNIYNKNPINFKAFFQWHFFKFFNGICQTAAFGPFWLKWTIKAKVSQKLPPQNDKFSFLFANLIGINEIRV